MEDFRWYHDEFDSKILEKPVYKLIAAADCTDFPALGERILGVSAPGMICCITAHNPRLFAFLKNEEFGLITTRNTYQLKVTSSIPAQDQPADMRILGKGELSEDSAQNGFDSLLAEIIPKSRFAKDERIPAAKTREIYRQWLHNSFFCGFADEFFVAEVQGQFAGLITLKIRQSRGCIDLIVVDRKFQGLKIGKALLRLARISLADRGIGSMKVETEGENIQANVFYQRNGFVLENFELIFHRHF